MSFYRYEMYSVEYMMNMSLDSWWNMFSKKYAYVLHFMPFALNKYECHLNVLSETLSKDLLTYIQTKPLIMFHNKLDIHRDN